MIFEELKILQFIFQSNLLSGTTGLIAQQVNYYAARQFTRPSNAVYDSASQCGSILHDLQRRMTS